MRFLEMKGSCDPRIKRIETVAKMDFRVHLKRTCSCGIQELPLVARERAGSASALEASGQRVVGDDGGVQRGAVLNLASQGVARNVGEPAVAKQRDIKILRNAGGQAPDGRDV